MTKKQDNSEDMDDEGKKKVYNGDEDREEDKKKDDSIIKRLDAVEKTNDSIIKKLDAILSSVSKEDEDMDDEDKKKDDEEMPEEDKKKDHEDMPMDDEDKKKDDDEPMNEEDKKKEEGEPKPGQGEVLLPQADAGETDETATAETDQVQVVEKNKKMLDAAIKKGVRDVLKGIGIQKSTTPRVEHDIAKRQDIEKVDFARDMMKKVRAGKMSMADMNREVKVFVKKKYDSGIEEFLEADRAKRGA